MTDPRGSSHSAACSIVAEAFGDVLEGARKRRNLSLDLVAARARISVAHLYMIEHAQTQPRINVLFRLAEAVGVSPVWLLDEVIAWLIPHAAPGGTAVASARITDQEAKFIYQLIGARQARTWR
jgi:transcriptional regulator with XRE-family HTH domain